MFVVSKAGTVHREDCPHISNGPAQLSPWVEGDPKAHVCRVCLPRVAR